MNPRRLLAAALLTLGAVLATELARALNDLTGVERLEELTLALRQQVTPRDRSSDGEASPILLVFFDRESVETWPYESPYPRDHLAELVEALSAAGARTIGVDVWLERRYPRLDAAFPGDDRLARAIEEAGNVVLVAPTVAGEEGPELALPHPDFAAGAAAVASADLPNPFEDFRDAALVTRNRDGVAPGFALALYALSRGLDLDSLLAASWESGRVALPGLPAPLGRIPEGWRSGGPVPLEEAVVSIPIAFQGPPSHVAVEGRGEVRTFDAFAAAEVPLLASFSPEFFQDRIVLLGTGFHDSDKFRTPFRGFREVEGAGAGGSMAGAASGPAADQAPTADPYQWTFGVEVHANVLQNLLDGRYIRTFGAGARLLLLLLAAGLAVGAVFRFGTGWGAALAAGVALAVVLGGFWLWSGSAYLFPGRALFALGPGYVFLPMVPGVLATILGYGGSTAYVAVVEGREKRFIKGAFGKYLSPTLVERIARNPAALQLGGAKRTLTILFSDLSGFTTLSERKDAQALVTQLNEYLDEMTELVLQERGYLDKYIGDAVMAFWNAPVPLDDHADRALRCAVLMQRRMADLNRRWQAEEEGMEPLAVRIGVNTGEAVVGNVGGKDRFDYSAIGDPVNLASRLEPANKSYGTFVMCARDTLDAATPGLVRVRELDRIAVVGKSEPVTVYEVLELGDHRFPPEREEALARYQEALEAYRRRDFAAAEAGFARALEADPLDGPSRVYRERAAAFATDPPPPDWDFVVRRSVK